MNAVRKLLEEGWSVHEPTDDGESLLSLACSAGTAVLFVGVGEGCPGGVT